jgi:hypothetical protein
MPFGVKSDPTGRPDIDFNRVYENGIRPAVEAAGMIPVRADEEKTGGIIHKPMFERLLLCEYAIADLTTANPNVFYELGVRHTARPRTTQAVYAKHQPIPFDVNFLRALPYELGENNRFGDEEAVALRQALTRRLRDLGERAEYEDVDSPLFQLLGEWQPGDVARLKTDIFRDRVQMNESIKERIRRGRAMPPQEGLATLRALAEELLQSGYYEAGILVDLMLSFRALSGWNEMIELYERMSETLKCQILVREQLGFAYNRRAGMKSRTIGDQRADRQRALEILQGVVDQQGPNSETCGLIGRIYKDQWDESRENDPILATGYLDSAIDNYLLGFRADQRDAFPGINAVTLLELRGDPESMKLRDKLVPVVQFAVDRRLEGKAPDYWDYATNVELAVLASNRAAATDHLGRALARVRERWEPETTARNMRLIREARLHRGEAVDWLDQLIMALESRAAA